MDRPDSSCLPSSASGASFPSTHWSMVLGAGLGDAAGSQELLAELCRKYWYPLYAYVRRRGYRWEDAQDLTQEFFARFLARKYLSLADPRRGRFRTFLLASLQHFLNDEWDQARATKRGGGSTPFSWDAAQAEERYLREPADDLTPERVYERRWAATLLGEVLARLRQEYVVAEKGLQFDALNAYLSDIDEAAPYARIAGQLGLSENAARAAVFRLRTRYRQILLGEIARTVQHPGDVEDEIRQLFAAFG
ncbi:MAG TPA: sigma factor [Phycisphaerae bacterium]|nr:sigma factor [Phycisphaerae bacterium]HRY71430.1 sigma factor [Phycisphaerae bacterium]HSA29970.1 sigma factor [Phycisphaerae bacterium]